MQKKRIQVYADEQTKCRVQLAAAKHNMAVTEYCLSAIEQKLADDDMLEREQVEISVTSTGDKDLIRDLRTLRETILTDRKGRQINVDDIVEQVRAERDYGLTGLY